MVNTINSAGGDGNDWYAVQNTGSGGGSGGPGSVGDPQAGASGIVLIAYPT